MKTYDTSIWAELKEKLPWQKTPADLAKRKETWNRIDMNGNGYLSLAEIDKGMRDIIKLPALFETKPVMMRAFNAAKDKVKGRSKYSQDYIEKKEYRFLLKYLRQYYEYWVAFDQIDLDSDKRITLKEFKKASPQLSNWGIDMSDAEAQW